MYFLFWRTKLFCSSFASAKSFLSNVRFVVWMRVTLIFFLSKLKFDMLANQTSSVSLSFTFQNFVQFFLLLEYTNWLQFPRVPFLGFPFSFLKCGATFYLMSQAFYSSLSSSKNTARFLSSRIFLSPTGVSMPKKSWIFSTPLRTTHQPPITKWDPHCLPDFKQLNFASSYLHSFDASQQRLFCTVH